MKVYVVIRTLGPGDDLFEILSIFSEQVYAEQFVEQQKQADSRYHYHIELYDVIGERNG